MLRRPPRSTLFPYRRSSDLDLEVRAVTQHRVTQRGAACQQMLAVVEDQQRSAWAEVIEERRNWICVGRERYSHRSEEHTSELQSQFHLVCRLLLEKKNSAGD